MASMRHSRELSRERIARLSASLSSLSPLAVLERGYAVVWKQEVRAPTCRDRGHDRRYAPHSARARAFAGSRGAGRGGCVNGWARLPD